MRLAVTGKQGQVTLALQGLARPGVEIVALGRPLLDLSEPSSIRPAIHEVRPDIVVSAAAYTAVDAAETDSEQAFVINRDGARAVAAAAAELDVPVIHLSTDYVFDGSKNGPYVEEDPTDPITVYGKSKREGETAVAQATSNHVILRTAWVHSPYGKNFIKTILGLAETREEIAVVADQKGCPTSAEEIAEAILKISNQLLSTRSSEFRGLFHLAGTGETSWADFARLVLSELEARTGRHVAVRNISTVEYPTPARRPANSVLCCAKLERHYGIRLPPWSLSVRAVVEALLRKQEKIH